MTNLRRLRIEQVVDKVVDGNGRAYNRMTFLSRRMEMMQKWADYIDQLRRV